MVFSIPCFNDPVKELINNYESGKVTCIYGNAASGKTTCCLLATIACAKSNGKIIYVDTESGFNTERLKQLYFGDVEDIMDNVFLLQPKSFTEQNETILKLKKLCDNDSIKLIIIDTIGHHYRKIRNDKPKETNAIMAEQMANVVRIARDLNKVVLITNQVYSQLENNEFRMVGGSLTEKMCKVIIELKKTENNRYATLKKYKQEPEDTSYYELGKKIKFEIKEKGLFIQE